MNKIITLAIILLSIFSCKNKETTKVDVSDIDVEVLIDRFDQKFFTANEKTLQELKKQYPYLFPIENDSIWLQKITDEEGVILFNKAQKVFENFDNEKLQIIDLFKHVKYYHPNFKSPI
jgi:sugar-specific transcriptional regulator TrmB